MDLGTCDLSDLHGDKAHVVPPVVRHFGGRRRFSGEIVTIKCFEDNSRVKELANTPGEGLKGVITRVASPGRIRGRGNTGTCRKHQKQVAVSIKRAREMALLPYVGDSQEPQARSRSRYSE